MRAWILAALVLCALCSAPALCAAQDPKPPAPPAAPQDPVVECGRCHASGRVPCPEHPKSLCDQESECVFCSAISDCATCGGVGWIPCPTCHNDPAREALEKRKQLVVTRKLALKQLDDAMGRVLRKAESAHFILVWELDRLKVERRELNAHELVHLYLERLERVYEDYLALLHIDGKQFNEKFHVYVWWLPQDQLDGSLHFCKQGSTGGIKLLGSTPSYSICGNKQRFQGDEQLHRNIVHCVAHLLLSAQRPVFWIGNIKCGWADEGLAHWFTDKYWGICDTYCYQEANTNVDFKGGRFRLNMRKMVESGQVPPMADTLQQNIDTLTLPMQATSFSYVDFLLAKDPVKFNDLMKKLKAKVPGREAIQQIYGFSVLEFEAQWKAWVLETYPKK